jgi:hypothetical protein
MKIPELHRRFEIPVFFLESRFVSKNRIDLDRLKLVLDEWEKANKFEA